VSTQIGDAVKFNLMDRSGIGGKTVSQWAQEWYHQNRPAGEGFSEKTSSLREGLPAGIQRGEDTVANQQAEIGSSVQNQQQAIHAGLGSERGDTITQGQGVRRDVEDTRQGIEATVDSGKAKISDRRAVIDQTGETMQARVEDLQREEVSLGKTAVEGIKDLNPWRDPSESHLAEGREKLFENTPPHPNFYWEERLRKLDEIRKDRGH
jgi:hypothetical protein